MMTRREFVSGLTAVGTTSWLGTEAGMIKSSPNKLIAQGTDWRFLNELKKELKG
ncbi:MAG: hypothetical protein ACREK6_20670 [Candidatus Rokuibacteriota bacterium]